MFDENANKALIGAKNGAVEHDGAVFFAIFTHIAGIQPLRKHAVGLNGAHLPRAADGVRQVPLKFGGIESAFAGQFFKTVGLVEPGFQHGGAKFGLGFVPHFIGAEAFFRAQRQFDGVVGEAKVFINRISQFAEFAHFFHNLIFAAENMSVILCKLTHAHEAV